MQCEAECDQCAGVNNLIQRVSTTFYLRTILQKRDTSRATSNKMMYETTDAQHLRLKDGRYVSSSLKLLHNSK